MYIRTYLQTVTCVCVCICVWAGRSDAAGWTTNRTGPDSVFLFLSLYYLHTKITKIVCRHALRRRDATRLKHPLAVPYMYHPFSFGFTRIVEALLNMCFPRETSTINFLHLFDKASQRTNDGCICIRIYRYSIESFFCRLSAPYEDIPITLLKGPYTLTLIRNRYHKD